MKNFFAEFKKFITRGNVVDMAVGVIVGSSFTAIVNGMSNFILKPLINWLLAIIFGADSLKDLYTMLKPAYVLDEAGNATAELDLVNSIYIDWGSFINAVINFFLIALVLFTIVKIMNKMREEHKEMLQNIDKAKMSRAQRKELRAHGIKRKDKEAATLYFLEKARAAEAAEEAAKAEAEAAAAAERAANPTAEDLLKEIIVLLKKD